MPNKPENPMKPKEIVQLRADLGEISQSALAKMVNVEVTTISRWETGRAIPNQYHDMKLKKLLKKTRG